MRIGELSRRTGISERLLRYYEEQGLLEPARSSSGYWHYEEDDVRTVGHIRILLAAGLNTTTIAGLLPCMVEENGELVAVCPELVPEFERERERLSASIGKLQAARSILDTIIATPLPAGVYSAADRA
jgi:DNA-binding transcriptional MerR regulator